MINLDYFIDSIDYFYDTYPVLRHILRYPESMANLIYEKTETEYIYYINISVINSVKLYYEDKYNEKEILKRILKYNDVFDGTKFTIHIYTTNNNYKKYEYKNFITKYDYEGICDVMSGVKMFKLDNKVVAKINIDPGMMLKDIWIDYNIIRSNILGVILKGYQYENKDSEADTIIYQILSQINKITYHDRIIIS